MTRFRTRVAMDAGLAALALGLGAGWLGGRTALAGIVAGAALAVADFWWLSSRLEHLDGASPRAVAWVGAAGLRLGAVALAVAGLFLTGHFHPIALVIGLAVLPCALVAGGLRRAREGA